MAFTDFAMRAVLGTVLGAVIGSERERSHGQHTAGIRTFSLISLLGSLCGIFSQTGIFAFVEALPIFGLAAVVAYTYYLHKNLSAPKRLKVGMTTLISMPLIYMSGLLVGLGYYTEGVVSTFIILGVLYIGQSMHRKIENLKKEHVNEIIQFSLILFVLYPLLPKAPVNFMSVIIDFNYLFLIVLLLSLINLAMFLINIFYKRSTSLTSGFLCGVISSTAAIYYFSKKSKSTGQNYVLGATAAMLGSISRNTLLIAVLLTDVFIALLPFFAAIAIALGAFIFLERKRMKLKFLFEQPFNIVNGSAAVIVIFAGTALFQLLSQRLPFAISIASFIGSAFSSTLVILSLSSSIHLVPLLNIKTAIISAFAGSFVVDIATAALHRSNGFFKAVVIQALILIAIAVLFLLLSL